VSAATVPPSGAPARTVPRFLWAIVAMHVVVVAIPVSFAVAGSGAAEGSAAAAVALLAGLALLALQLRHSLAAIRGLRPRGGVWTLLAVAALVYLPMTWFGWNWIVAQGLLLASALMVLRARLAAALAVVVIVITDVVTARAAMAEGLPLGALAYQVAYATFASVATPASLYGSAWLVRVLDELHATQTELAALAVGRERLQIARNLHDLLGQSLSAISLKGDLALRLLRRDPPAARAEIESLTGVARDALRDVRAVTRDQHTVTLAKELDGAAALLAAAGIQPHLDVNLPGLPVATEQVLAWAVREGVTNVLRHSQAGSCAITAGRRGGSARLEIVNDGAGEPAGEGSGLAGLSRRAGALAGTVTSGPTGDGRFRLLLEIPEETA
jgi:two-component system, NarL family, sensor histidine kinase DesK